MNSTPSIARIGVAELRSRLSHFLKQAHRGRRVIVTDHGEPLVEIVPLNLNSGGNAPSAIEEKLEQLADTGFMTYAPARTRAHFKKFKPIAVGAPEECIASNILIKDREGSW